MCSNQDIQTDLGMNSNEDISHLFPTVKNKAKVVPEHVIIMMCEIFQKELIELSNEVFPGDKEKTLKIKMIVGSILAKAKKGLLALGLPSVGIHPSPKKQGEQFTDMHAYSSGKKEPIKKSWHLVMED